MSTPTDELLNQRRLRAAEIALEAARRRRHEADDTVRALRNEVADVEAAMAAMVAASEREREVAQSELEAAQRAQLVAEQALLDERRRRLELEARSPDGSVREELTRQLAAEQRNRELEAELELVSRRASEFEYGVRMAAFDAFKVVRELVDRVGSVLPDLRGALFELSLADPTGQAESAGSAGDPTSEEAELAMSSPASTGLDAERLDAALDRLRATIPSPPERE